MASSSIRSLSVALICLLAFVGCNRSNTVEVTQAKAEAEAARAEAQAAKAELTKEKARADGAEAELAKLKTVHAQPKAPEADRRAAEWVLRSGGIVRVISEGVASEFPKEGKLPDGPLKVTYVSVVEPGKQNKLTNEGMKYLEGLKHLVKLDMTAKGVDDYSFLKGMDSLESFNLWWEHVEFTDAGLVHLKNLPRIKEVVIGAYWGNDKLTDAGLATLKEMKTLEVLNLTGCKITDGGLSNLSNLNKLRSLTLYGTQISDNGLQHLKGLTELRELVMQGTPVTGSGLEHLKGLSQLVVINLAHSKVSDAGLIHLKAMSNLRHLGLTDTQVTDDGIKALKAAIPNCNIGSNVKK